MVLKHRALRRQTTLDDVITGSLWVSAFDCVRNEGTVESKMMGRECGDAMPVERTKEKP